MNKLDELEILREYASAHSAQPDGGVDEEIWDAWITRWYAAKRAYDTLMREEE